MELTRVSAFWKPYC